MKRIYQMSLSLWIIGIVLGGTGCGDAAGGDPVEVINETSALMCEYWTDCFVEAELSEAADRDDEISACIFQSEIRDGDLTTAVVNACAAAFSGYVACLEQIPCSAWDQGRDPGCGVEFDAYLDDCNGPIYDNPKN